MIDTVCGLSKDRNGGGRRYHSTRDEQRLEDKQRLRLFYKQVLLLDIAIQRLVSLFSGILYSNI